jgi:hypothetical protein
MNRMHYAVSVCATAAFLAASAAGAQDLSRYRDFTFGSSVTSVMAGSGGTGFGVVSAVHTRPALIQELIWRPPYTFSGSGARLESAREVTLRFIDDQLFSIAVTYDVLRVEGLSNQDLIDGVSATYGAAVTSAAAKSARQQPPSGQLNVSTALATWDSADYRFTLMGEFYPATFRLLGTSKRLEALARAAQTEAVRLDKEEAPRREAERIVADTERKRTADERTRSTNKADFKP